MHKSVFSGGKTILNDQNVWIHMDLCIDLDINPCVVLIGIYMHAFPICARYLIFKLSDHFKELFKFV